MKLNPLTLKKLNRFRSIKRGYYSAIILFILMMLSAFAELWVNNRAIVVSYEGNWYFPTYSDVYPGKTFGLDYAYETKYRELQLQFEQGGGDNWIVMPIIPYNPFENTYSEDEYPPTAPSFEDKHYLGTDTYGRDVAARLIYGFRLAMGFAFLVMAICYAIGVTVGCFMGYWGGKVDLFGQRIIEIWSQLPGIYVIMIIVSIFGSNFWLFVMIIVMFNWTAMTWYMRTLTYKEKAREYVMAAKAQGASTARIIFKHIMPNTLMMIVTMAPFTIVGNLTLLTSLDYLGLGLAPPTPSWGEMLSQGKDNLDAVWIVASVVTAIVLVLTMVTFVGEAIREAFDPKKHTKYI
ncbi:ABC transporter permease subunit [Motilimonas cestriensis]|uniref:ABC transporter permease subunit n=1 Tax=Motilimonas cestriensis TaxID=2742685 RepID=A0ABS8W6Y0_9GAMM|nr:ABC transporter permease subunit [Motilimonas cestriensis]MCE2593508.1 ABC transporter permease subunit [Motilimonas cestriensis]